MKKCNKCKTEKELLEFNKRKKSKDGLSPICKKCKKIQDREYREKNREKVLENSKNWAFNNKEKTKDIKNKWVLNNTEKAKESSKKWREKNLSRINIIRQRRKKERLKNDTLFKLETAIRDSINNSLGRNFYTKNSRTYEILGCSFEEFKNYIESKFEPWMNWNNHGKYTGNYNETWQYDHIIPISFGRTEEEIIKLNHYTNFQPLCSRVNQYDKGDKLDW